MTRRHDALIPLTHDHHHALHQLRLLRKGADEDPAGRVRAAHAFSVFFRDHAVMHFREEEEEVFPLLVGIAGAPMDGVTRILLEHVELHAQMKELERQASASDVDADLMRALADALKRHIRFEEDELFPAIEAAVTDALNGVTLADRDRGPGL